MTEHDKIEKFTISQLRGFRGLTKEDLAKKSGVTSRTIITYENDIQKLRSGKYTTLEKIAKALGVKVNDIFLDPDSEKPKQMCWEK